MATTSCYRRNHAKSYPVSLRHFQASKESLVFTSPPPLNLKSKLHLTSNLSNASENSLLSTRILADRTNLMHTQAKPKKRVKLNCVNPVSAQTIARRPLKSPKVYKLLQTSTADRLSTTVRPFPFQEVSTFKCEDLLTKIFRAPNNSKTGTAKKFSGRKSNENFGKSRNSLGNKGAMSTRITDTTMLGMSPGNKNNVLDFTGVGVASLDDLLVTDQSMVYHNTDKAEDLNRKLRSIFRGEKLDSSQNGEFEISVAEEKSDFKLKVFKTKPLIRQLKS